MAVLDILRAARARIADPAHWTTDELARDSAGRTVRGNDPRAVCWCAIGALEAVGGDALGEERLALNEQAGILFAEIGAAVVNDMHGHAAVLQMYDAAIAAAEAEGR